MKYIVYVIESREGYRYTGQTNDLERRIEEHNSGLSHSTKHGKNWKVIYTEEKSSRSEAMKLEKWLKTGVGREWLERLLGG
jgi:putative endonuclease